MMHPGLGYFDVHFLFLWSSGGNIFLRKKKLLFVSGFSLAEKTNLKTFGEQYYLRNNSIYIDILYVAAAAAKSLQFCPTLCDPIDGSPSGASIPGILQARTLEWDAISFSNAWKWKVKNESEVAQSCLTLSDPMDCSPPGSSAHGIFPGKNTGVGCHCLLYYMLCIYVMCIYYRYRYIFSICFYLLCLLTSLHL